MNDRHRHDVLVIGSGAAGLAAALHLAPHARIAVLSKKELDAGATDWAQGGIAAVTDPGDSEYDHVQDTLHAGAGLCDEKMVTFTVYHAREAISQLIDWGVKFDRQQQGFHLGQEGGHSFRRVLHVADATGHAIESNLIREAGAHPNIELFTHHIAIDLITEARLARMGARSGDAGGDVDPAGNRCIGAYVYNSRTDHVEVFEARFVVLATGGASKVYLYTSNPDGATGDGIAMAWRAGCRIANMEFNQFHPTCLFHPHAKSFLISEAVRGEGGVLLRPDGERFMQSFDPRGELAPRDVVARAIDHEIKRLGVDCVFLDISHQPAALIKNHFPNIYARCAALGIDITREPMPVVPAAHYTCGGVLVNRHGVTDIAALYAIGETSYTGLHGANRLASNSLLECLVFAKSAADHIRHRLGAELQGPDVPDWDESKVTDSDEDVVISHNWQELRQFMWDYVGIVRTDKRLQRALHRIRLLKHEVHDYYSNYRVGSDLIELRNLIHVAELIVRSAQARRESRGLHFTLDYPQPAELAQHTILGPQLPDPLDVMQPLNGQSAMLRD
jgi:L-aspartate oxidase